MQKKCFSRAARAENARHAKLVRDLAKEFGKDATWQLAAMDALRKANPDELELMHGLTAAKTLEFVDALIQFKTSAAGLGVGSASGAGELELSVPWDLLPYAQLELNGRYSNAVPEPVGRARDISSERVVVRFVRRYGADAHRAWAAAGLAPALYAFAGAVGAARYPPSLNMRSDSGSVSVELRSTRGSCGSSTQPDVAWPAGVEFDAPVLQEHDTALLSLSIEQMWLRAASTAPQPQPQLQLPQWLQQWRGAGTAASAAAAAAAGAPAADGSGVEARDSGSAPSASRRGSRRRAARARGTILTGQQQRAAWAASSG
eukprot:XP_001691460.1 predicted protein [Chlamydomonas reinhardtii]